MAANHIPVYGHGQVDARVNLAELTCGDLIWIVIDATPLAHRIQVRVVAVEPILCQLRYQAWIIGHYRQQIYPNPGRITEASHPDIQHPTYDNPAHRLHQQPHWTGH